MQRAIVENEPGERVWKRLGKGREPVLTERRIAPREREKAAAPVVGSTAP
jgi:hypothetical protein